MIMRARDKNNTLTIGMIDTSLSLLQPDTMHIVCHNVENNFKVYNYIKKNYT